jgi:hypothetical protein
MYKRILIFLVLVNLLVGAGLAQKLSQKEIARYKTQIVKLQKEIVRLKNKLAVTQAKKTRIDILDKIDVNQAQINKLNKLLYPKPVPKPEVKVPQAKPTFEAAPEEAITPEEEGLKKAKRGFSYEVGGVYGFFAGATTFLGEVRFPFRYVLGPAVTSVRAATGLAQSRGMDRKYVPLNLDLIFNFPAGFFTGVENYIGAGLNYVVLTSGSKQGTIGGEIFYGVESEGFGGIVFGELGYAYLCTGFSASHNGVTALVGYRKTP